MSRRWSVAALAILFVFSLACVWTGVDFGKHWDENYNVRARVADSVKNGSILPGWYYFPSGLHEIALAALSPEAVDALVQGKDVRQVLLETIPSQRYLLRLRRIVGLLSATAILSIYAAAFFWRRSHGEALAAASIAACSWELQYHSRWVTADPLLAAAGALTLLLSLAAARRSSPRLLWGAAAAAGIGCGIKYPGGALLIVVLAAALTLQQPLRRVLQCGVSFVLVFLVTTPALIVAPGTVFDHLTEQIRIYSSHWSIYTVAGPVEHARLLGEYLALVQLAPIPAIAGLFFLAALAGAVVAFRADRRAFAILAAFPAFYLTYFSLQKVMIVRNMLVLIPFLAVLGGIGLTRIVTLVRSSGLRALVGSAMALLVLTCGAWLAHAASTIQQPPEEYVASAAAWVDEQPTGTVALSNGVARLLERYDGKQRPRLSPRDPRVERVVYLAKELRHSQHVANRRDTTEMWFGPYEVNFNYYPTWAGRDRIVVSRKEKMRMFQEVP